MRSPVRRTAVATLAVATIALLGACGSGSSGHAKDTDGAVKDLAPGTALAAADAKDLMSAATASMTSMRISGDVTSGSSGGIHMEGVEQTKPTVLAQVKESIAGQEMEVRMIGSEMYVQMPASAGSLPGGKKWLSMNFDDLGSLAGMDTSGLSQAMSDPASSVAKYSKYVTNGTYVGPEKVDGVDAKHYTFNVDLAGAMGSMMPSGVPSSMAGSIPKSASEDAWIDGDGHPVEMKVDMGKLGVFTMHMSDFGTKVAVEAPPKDEVADMKQLMGKLSGAAD